MDEAKNRSIKYLINSEDKIDKQFVNMFRIRQAARFGIKIGFKGFGEDSIKDPWQEYDEDNA